MHRVVVFDAPSEWTATIYALHKMALTSDLHVNCPAQTGLPVSILVTSCANTSLNPTMTCDNCNARLAHNSEESTSGQSSRHTTPESGYATPDSRADTDMQDAKSDPILLDMQAPTDSQMLEASIILANGHTAAPVVLNSDLDSDADSDADSDFSWLRNNLSRNTKSAAHLKKLADQLCTESTTSCLVGQLRPTSSSLPASTRSDNLPQSYTDYISDQLANPNIFTPYVRDNSNSPWDHVKRAFTLVWLHTIHEKLASLCAINTLKVHQRDDGSPYLASFTHEKHANGKGSRSYAYDLILEMLNQSDAHAQPTRHPITLEKMKKSVGEGKKWAELVQQLGLAMLVCVCFGGDIRKPFLSLLAKQRSTLLEYLATHRLESVTYTSGYNERVQRLLSLDLVDVAATLSALQAPESTRQLYCVFPSTPTPI